VTVPWKGWRGIGFTPADFITYVGSLRWVSWRPSLVVVHNTENPTLERWHEIGGTQYMKNLEKYYRDTMGWSAGPHLFIDDAVIWVGTPLTVSGVHSPSWNGVSFGVETVGDYAREPLLPAVAQNLASALATLHDALGLLPETAIRFHKEDPATTHRGCPGKNLVKPDLIAAVRAKLDVRHGHAGEHLPDRLIA
jgi:hypothetical protein